MEYLDCNIIKHYLDNYNKEAAAELLIVSCGKGVISANIHQFLNQDMVVVIDNQGDSCVMEVTYVEEDVSFANFYVIMDTDNSISDLVAGLQIIIYDVFTLGACATKSYQEVEIKVKISLV